MVKNVPITTNGEKQLLWKFLEISVTIIGAAALLATAINAWVVRDYLEFKQTSSVRWEKEASRDAFRDEQIRWQQEVLRQVAKKLDIVVPPPPARAIQPLAE